MVTIKLPEANVAGVQIKHFLKQLELSVHHAQKAYEQMEKDGMITEDSYIAYKFSTLNLYKREEVDEETELSIELEIVK